MARAMNAVGFHHSQLMKFIMSSKVEKIDNITEKEDGEERNEVVQDILKRMFMRPSPKPRYYQHHS